MKISDHEPTEEERAEVRAITEEYPTASKVIRVAFYLIDGLADNSEKTKMELILGFELGLRSAVGADLEVIRQVVELMDRGRAKVGNQETAMITSMIASLIQRAAREGEVI